MVKKINIIMVMVILSVVLLGIQSGATALSGNNSFGNSSYGNSSSGNISHPTHINIVLMKHNDFSNIIDPVHNPFGMNVFASLVDETTGKKLGGRNLRFELISPDYGIEEVTYDTTSKWSLFYHEAKASFDGPFNSGVWKVRISYGGNSKDHLASSYVITDLPNIN